MQTHVKFWTSALRFFKGFDPRSFDKHSLCATQIHSAFGDGNLRAILLYVFRRALRRSLPASVLPRAVSQLRWGVVQLVGHLTVNEDGEGSNPSAPANLPL